MSHFLNVSRANSVARLIKGEVPMSKSRPTKWAPWALLGAGLPLLASYVIGTGSLTQDIRSRTGQALSANEQTAWAKIENNGRLIGTGKFLIQ